MNGQRIFITGFMGSGKTTVARELARRLNCGWVDLDDLITKQERRTPGEIIDQDGEEKFRETETQMLRQVLGTRSEQVIAAGGGAWTIADNRKLLAQHGAITIWLDAPFKLCWNRIEASGQERPLAPSYEAARRRYQERLDTYALSDFRLVVTENETPEEIGLRIAGLISRDGTNN
ncbi:MAG: AAA family ATPase [Acidobacteriota bacterium]|nr:AAA family ATPase [Acidobacteriota bacterium]